MLSHFAPWQIYCFSQFNGLVLQEALRSHTLSVMPSLTKTPHLCPHRSEFTVESKEEMTGTLCREIFYKLNFFFLNPLSHHLLKRNNMTCCHFTQKRCFYSALSGRLSGPLAKGPMSAFQRGTSWIFKSNIKALAGGSVGWSIVLQTKRSWVWLLVRAHAQVMGSIPVWGVFKRQPINVSHSHRCPSLPPHSSLEKHNGKKKKRPPVRIKKIKAT